MKFALSIMVALMGTLLAVAVGISCITQKNSPSSVVRSFYEYGVKGEVDKALQLTTNIYKNVGALPINT